MTKARVLIVDDDEHISFVASRALEEIAACDVAGDADAARRWLDRYDYDLALIDVGLPGPSGLTLLDHVRAATPHTGVVMLSGLDDLEVARDALARGAVAYVVKPFRIRDLRIQVTAALATMERAGTTNRQAARTRVVAALRAALDAHACSTCVVVDIAQVSLLDAVYGASCVDELTARLDQRARDFDPAVRVLGQLGPSSLVAALPETARPLASVAQELYGALSAPVVIDAKRMPMPIHLGLAPAAPDDDAGAVLGRAEAAMRSAADAGPWQIYDAASADAARSQIELLADAASAIQLGDLHVVYQPQVELASGAVFGYEALVRWNHPTHGDVPPAAFIPLAEQMGLMRELGTFVLRTACADIAALRTSGRDVRVSVNVSPSELHAPDYLDTVATVLADTGLPAPALSLEITETIALDVTLDLPALLDGLVAMGVVLSIDDFGSGYSSLATLARVPWQELKIDQSLTAQHAGARGREMLASVFALGRALDVAVIGEGIETDAQLAVLRAVGCRLGQGYLLGRPAPISALARA